MVIAAAAASASSISCGPSNCHHCHAEGAICSTSYVVSNSWVRSPFEVKRVSDHSGISFGCGNPSFGATLSNWLPVQRDSCLLKVSVAADYSDSVPDSSNTLGHNGYHPLEELKDHRRVRHTQLTSAEIARNTVEANNSALLIFPGTVHCEPHENISWSECRYVVDGFGDIYFEIQDDGNILHDPRASSPVNALIGMDIPLYDHRKVDTIDYDISETETRDGILLDDDYIEVEGSEIFDSPVDWGMPDNSRLVHPIYFAKCLTKAVNMEYCKKMDHPSNGVSILGCLFLDEEIYARRLFNDEDSDGYFSDWKGDEFSSFVSRVDENHATSTIYKLEIIRIELFSVYGVQSVITLGEFQDAEPDIVVHSTSAILNRFSEKGMRYNPALRSLCKKKGLDVEGASLIGVDSLGIDVRVFSGREVRTHRFPFRVRATSEGAVEKQIMQLLYPRSQRKRFRAPGDGYGDPDIL